MDTNVSKTGWLLLFISAILGPSPQTAVRTGTPPFEGRLYAVVSSWTPAERLTRNDAARVTPSLRPRFERFMRCQATFRSRLPDTNEFFRKAALPHQRVLERALACLIEAPHCGVVGRLRDTCPNSLRMGGAVVIATRGSELRGSVDRRASGFTAGAVSLPVCRRESTLRVRITRWRKGPDGDDGSGCAVSGVHRPSAQCRSDGRLGGERSRRVDLCLPKCGRTPAGLLNANSCPPVNERPANTRLHPTAAAPDAARPQVNRSR